MFKVKRIETSFVNGEFDQGQIYNAYENEDNTYVIDSNGKEHMYGRGSGKIPFGRAFEKVNENTLFREVLLGGTQN